MKILVNTLLAANEDSEHTFISKNYNQSTGSVSHIIKTGAESGLCCNILGIPLLIVVAILYQVKWSAYSHAAKYHRP
jgi:hypothetical protein